MAAVLTPKRVALGLLALALLAAAGLWLNRALRAVAIARGQQTWQAPAGAAELPADRSGLPGIAEAHWTLAGGARQRAFHLPSENGAVIVYAHGSPGTAVSSLREAAGLARRGYGAVLPDLPSFGKSEGARTWGASFRESLRKAIDFARAQPGVDPDRIGLFGFSMGATLALQVAAEDGRVAAVVARAPFTSLADQRRYQYRTRMPWVPELAIFTERALGLAVDELAAESAVARLGARPALLIVGDRDGVVPVAMVNQLQLAADDAQLWIVKGAGHLDLVERAGEAAYIDRIAAFFADGLD